MTKIFMSYRREESESETDRIYEKLTEYFGDDAVFKDSYSIPSGDEFPKTIKRAAEQCFVGLVVIGKRWPAIFAERQNSPTDWVKTEIELLLSRKEVKIIPILVQNASMPPREALPDSIQALATRQGPLVRSGPDFKNDMTQLIEAISALGIPKKRPVIMPENLPEGMFSLPLLDWCRVSAGTVVLDHRVTSINAFHISKYPVTNAQYERFILAPDGYNSPLWWDFSAEARNWRDQHPQAPDPYFLGDDCPRESVSWYDAVAFCRWLSDKTGLSITLPSTQQWRRAGQGDTNQLHAWGDVDDPARRNAADSKLRRTTPVDKYPEGVSPFVVYDMCGNVWEWCLSTVLDDTDLKGKTSRVVCGGSWDIMNPYITDKITRECDHYYNDTGFRLVALPK
jgi:hypothetical protein